MGFLHQAARLPGAFFLWLSQNQSTFFYRKSYKKVE